MGLVAFQIVMNDGLGWPFQLIENSLPRAKPGKFVKVSSSLEAAM
jgi:hypothetical protein